MSGNRETKNFGLIKAIHTGVNPPLNTKILWYDDNPGVKIHKAYNVVSSAWEPFGGGATVNGIYTYIGYATDVQGANFKTVKDGNSTHWAVITSTSAISTLTSTLFAGRWAKFDGVGSGGNFTYVGYADDDSGSNFSVEPKYEVACSICSWVDSFVERSKVGGFTFTPVTDGIQIDFTNLVFDDILELEVKRGAQSIPNLTDQYFEIVQAAAWSANGVLEVNTDANSIDNYVLNNEGGTSDTFIKRVSGSVVRIKVSPNGVSGFSGSITLKVGSTECEPGYTQPATCYEYRKYIGIKTQDTVASVVDASLFSDLWLPVTSVYSGGDSSPSSSSTESLNKQIQNLWDEISTTNQTLSSLSTTYNTFASTQDTFNTTIQGEVDQNLIDANASLQQLDIDLAEAFKRANHTGTQAISTVTDLVTTLAALLKKSGNLTEVIYLSREDYQALVTAGTTVPTIIYLTPKEVV